MGGTELKTDSLHRWMMYSKDAYESGHIFLTTEQKREVEEGKRFAQRAYADVWARDSAVVQRVRSFLGTNFHWHQRLESSGTDLEVIQTLQSMIHGESVVLIAEQPRTGGAWIDPTPKPKGLPSFRKELMTRLGMSYDAATAYIDRYNDMVDEVNAAAARYSNGAVSSLTEAASNLSESATRLGDAQPFEYGDVALSDDTADLAGMPFKGVPGSWAVSEPGSMLQWRQYGAGGTPMTDFDFEAHHGNPNPHAHNWDGTSRAQGWPISILP
ncbi:hypothetical protein P0D72_33585 [Paraburkholderia sediminicola]|uniref:hypothetical protein n=1 Tax=Paraburkholderia sediminicola TaxID=458836 RepID=UPI0038B85032